MGDQLRQCSIAQQKAHPARHGVKEAGVLFAEEIALGAGSDQRAAGPTTEPQWHSYFGSYARAGNMVGQFAWSFVRATWQMWRPRLEQFRGLALALSREADHADFTFETADWLDGAPRRHAPGDVVDQDYLYAVSTECVSYDVRGTLKGRLELADVGRKQVFQRG